MRTSLIVLAIVAVLSIGVAVQASMDFVEPTYVDLLEASADESLSVDPVEFPVIPDLGDSSRPTAAELAAMVRFDKCGNSNEGVCARSYETCTGSLNLFSGCQMTEECCTPKNPLNKLFNIPMVQANANGAGIVNGVGTKCGAGLSGKCQARTSDCSGNLQAGLCNSYPGLTCCFSAGAAAPRFAQVDAEAEAEAETEAEAEAETDASADAEMETELPAAGQACGPSLKGMCTAQAKWCAAPKKLTPGFCAGTATCCMPAGSTPAVAPKPTPAAPAAPAAPTPMAPVDGAVCPMAAKMANIIFRRALPKSKGLCARYVGDAIQAGGKPGYVRTMYARNTGPQLIGAGFRLLPPGARLLPGDVRVIQPIPGHPAGHMEMYTGAPGGLWCSDFKQRDEWPGSPWRNNAKNIKFATYRLTC